MGKFIGIDEILQGRNTKPSHTLHSGGGEERGSTGQNLTGVSVGTAPQGEKYAVDAGMKEKQVIAQAIREFFERVEKE